MLKLAEVNFNLPSLGVRDVNAGDMLNSFDFNQHPLSTLVEPATFVAEPSPTPTPISTPSPTHVQTPTPTLTATPKPTTSASPNPTVSASPTPNIPEFSTPVISIIAVAMLAIAAWAVKPGFKKRKNT